MDLAIVIILAVGLVLGKDKPHNNVFIRSNKSKLWKRELTKTWRNVTLVRNNQRLVALHVPDKDGRPLELQFKDRRLKMRIRVPHHKNGTAITNAIVMEFENTDGKGNNTYTFKTPSQRITPTTNLSTNVVSSFVGNEAAPAVGNVLSTSPLQKAADAPPPSVNFGTSPVSPSQAQDDDIGFKISQALNAYMPHDSNGHVKVYNKKIDGVVHIFPFGGQKVQHPQTPGSKPMNITSSNSTQQKSEFSPYKDREPWVRHRHRKRPRWRRKCRILHSGRRVCRKVRIRRPHRYRNGHRHYSDDDFIPKGGLQGILDPKYRNIEWHNAPDIEDDFADNGIENKISKILDKLHLQQQVQGNEISKDDPVSFTQDDNQQFMNNPMSQMLPEQQDSTPSMFGQDPTSTLGQQNVISQSPRQVEIGPAAAQQLLQQMIQQQTENNVNSQAILPQSNLQSADMSQMVGQMNTGGMQSVTGLDSTGLNTLLGQQEAGNGLLGKQDIQQPTGLNLQSTQPTSVQDLGQTGSLSQLAGNQGISLQTDQTQSMLGGQPDGQLGVQQGTQLGGQMDVQMNSQLGGQLIGGQMGNVGGQIGILSQKHQISTRPNRGSKLFDPGVLKKIAERESMDLNESRAKAELASKYPALAREGEEQDDEMNTPLASPLPPPPYPKRVSRPLPPLPRHFPSHQRAHHRRERYGNSRFGGETGVLGDQMISVLNRDRDTNYPERFKKRTKVTRD